MRLTKQMIQDVVTQVVGEDAVPVVEHILKKTDVSEFVIADQLKMDMQVLRNILYRLHASNLASYFRKKDRKKGWYISYWTFNEKRVIELVPVLEKQQLEMYRRRLEQEQKNAGNFYICPNLCKRLDFDTAVGCYFKCPECGNLLNQQDNSRTIEFLKQKIKELEAL